MTEEYAEEKLSKEDFKLAEEVIKPIYHNADKNNYSFARYGVECYTAGYNKANEWHYVTDKLPPNPKESEDGISIIPLNYICAYDCGNGDYECDEFMYLGDGMWNGENKNYPIYAWMDCAVEVPLPPRKDNE